MKFTHTYNNFPALPVWEDADGDRPLLIVVNIHGAKTSIFIDPHDTNFSPRDEKTPKKSE